MTSRWAAVDLDAASSGRSVQPSGKDYAQFARKLDDDSLRPRRHWTVPIVGHQVGTDLGSETLSGRFL